MPGESQTVVQDRAKALDGLTYFIDPPHLTQPVLRPVLDYWEEKRSGRRLPLRSDIDPLELKAYLPHLFLIDVLPGAEFRYRLVGGEITERYGRNSTGRTVREIYAALPPIAEWLTDMMLAVTRLARPVFASGPLTVIGKEHVLSEALHLPLADAAGTIKQIFGATRYRPRSRS
jgi:hypothetical protein